jgi:hypothetical protein
MNKPYLVFAGDQYYPSGGTRDFQQAYETIEEARAAVKPWKEKNYWGHVAYFDGDTLTIVD